MRKNNILRKLKYEYGLCPSGVKIYKTCLNDTGKLIHIMKKWVELWIEHPKSLELFNLLTVDEIRQLKKSGVYCNEIVEVNGSENKEILLLGNSVANVNLQGFDVVKIYVLNNSKLKLSANDYAKCYIEAYHNAEVEVSVTGSNANVSTDKYDNTLINGGKIQAKQWESGDIFNYNWDIGDFARNAHAR